MRKTLHLTSRYGGKIDPHQDGCCFPGCEDVCGSVVTLPVCDRHAVETYRKVREVLGAPAPKGMPSSRAKFTPGLVYFIRQENLIKIGFSNDVARRRQTLGGGSVLATMPGDQFTERALHKKFNHLRAHGEWFRPGAELLDYIRSLRREPRDS